MRFCDLLTHRCCAGIGGSGSGAGPGCGLGRAASPARALGCGQKIGHMNSFALWRIDTLGNKRHIRFFNQCALGTKKGISHDLFFKENILCLPLLN